jgi:hypothetical protein
MVTDLHDDEPAFAVTVYSIMDRYRTGVVEHRTACRALSAITLALAPESLFDIEGEHRLGGFFAAKLDAYRDDRYAEVIKSDVVRVILAAAEADWNVLARYGVGK